MKKKKKLLIVLLAGVVVVCVGLHVFSGSILAAGIEAGGSSAIGTETTLESASFSLLGGSVSLSGLEIANPEGFNSKRAIRVGAIDVEASVTSFLSDVVRIEHIIIDSPEVTLEIGAGGTNLKRLLDNLGGGDGGGTERSGGDDAGWGKKLKIKLVRIVDPRVIVSAGVAGLASTTETVKLGTIELTDIGSQEDGGTVTLAGLMELIIATIGTNVAAEAKGLPPELAGVLEKEVASKVFSDVRNTVEKTAGTIKDATAKVADELKSGLEGILGTKKKD